MIVYITSDKQVNYHNGSVWATFGGSGGGGGSYTLYIQGNNFLLKDGATTVSTVLLSTGAPTANQLLMWDGTKWIATTLSQDVGNATGVVTVNGIKGKTIPALPTSTQALVYNGTAWVFQPLTGAGTVTSVATGTGLTGGPITTTGIINVDVGTTAGKIVQLDATGKLPAVDGSQLTNLPAGAGDITAVIAGTGLTGGAATGAATLNVDVGITAGKIVQVDGTGKLPAIDGSQLTNLAGGGDITGVIAGTGLTGGATSGTATLNVDVGTTASKIVQLDATGKLPAVDGSQLTNLPSGSGTVTNVSVITANGVSGTVTTPTTTPAITLTLGTITPTSVAATGTVTGSNLSGTNTGDQTSITGNAGTAAALQTGRTISLTGDVTYSSPSFNGTSNVTAAATVARINGNAVPANASGSLTNDGSGNLTWTPTGGSGTVTSVSGTLPISVATPTATPVISISQANGTTNGYLSSADWSTFNGKGSGTVTSVGLTMPSIFSVASSPVTSTGTIGVTYSGTALPVANGGTGRTTWNGLLLGSGATINDISTGTNGQILTVAGTTPTWADPTSAGWGLTGNAGTTPATNFLGTTDAQDLAFRSSNSEAMRITTSGDVGIGIAAPTSRLHLHNPLVQGNFMKITHLNAPSGITIGNSGSAGREAFIANNENAAMYFQTNALNRMTIDASGRVLINTVTGQANAILDIVPTGTGIGNIVLRGSSASPNDPVDIEFRNFTASTVLGKIYMNPANGTDMRFDANGTGVLTLQNDGKVGIGTTTPSEKLDINGSLLARGTFGTGTLTVTGAGAKMFYYPAKAAFRAGQVVDAGSGEQNNWNNSNIGDNSFAVGLNTLASNTNAFAGGDKSQATGVSSVAFGSVTAASRFASFAMGFSTVASGEQSAAFGLGTKAESTGSFAIGRYNVGGGDPVVVNGVDPIFEIGIGASDVARSNAMTVLKNGNVGIGRSPSANKLEVEGSASKTTATAWLANSDRRIKTDINDIDNSFELIKKLRPVRFKYTEHWKSLHPSIEDRFYYNFIAQEFQEVFPDAVQNSGEFLEGDEKSILQIDTYSAQITTIKAVQDLINKVEQLEAENKKLKSENGSLEAKVNIIEDQNKTLAKDVEELKRIFGAQAKNK